MVMAAGNVEYRIGQPPVAGVGVSLTGVELDAALHDSVADAVFDTSGTQTVKDFLDSLPSTDFDSAGVERVLSVGGFPEDWRVGEGLAEVYLSEHRSCYFPWPDSRDERKAGSSLPGADLVGLCRDGATERFAFGEVKTSSESQYPPGLMYGRTGMKRQLEDLRDSQEIRDDLVKYLAHRACAATWKMRFAVAFARYTNDSSDVRVFGVLVRDVPPHFGDLDARVACLAQAVPAGMRIELVAIYLPGNTIPGMGRRIKVRRRGGKT
jgi:hypothetical protein